MKKLQRPLQVQQALGRDPHAGDLPVFRGKRGSVIKIVWHDGLGMSLCAKRLEHGRFIWPAPANGAAAISASQLAYKGRIRAFMSRSEAAQSSKVVSIDAPDIHDLLDHGCPLIQKG